MSRSSPWLDGQGWRVEGCGLRGYGGESQDDRSEAWLLVGEAGKKLLWAEIDNGASGPAWIARA